MLLHTYILVHPHHIFTWGSLFHILFYYHLHFFCPNMARPRIILPTVLLAALCLGLYGFFGMPTLILLLTRRMLQLKLTIPPPGRSKSAHPLESLYSHHHNPTTAAPPPTLRTTSFSPTDQSLLARKPRYAITSSVQTASFTPMALMLGYSIQKHNDLAAMDAELVLLIREDAVDGVSAENKTRLEAAGWTLRVAEELTFPGVDNSAIRAHHRHNLNKLHLWTWTEYEKILFIDADVVCKGSLAELWDMPGEFAAAPDVWWDVITDSRFNSGVVVFRPGVETFGDMIKKVSDPAYHQPNDADQAFLNAYYRFRFFGLPYKYNFNLIMVCSLPPSSSSSSSYDFVQVARE